MICKKAMGKIGILVGMGMLAGSMAGCAKMQETIVVRTKGEDAIENYDEAEAGETEVKETGISQTVDGAADNSNQGIDLYTALGAPKAYQSKVSDTTGNLKVYTDAVVEIPEAAKVSAIYVSQHPFEKAEMELITKAFFDDADVYDVETYVEKSKEANKEALEKWELKQTESPFSFREELIDPFFPEAGSVNSFYGIVPMEDGKCYRYEMLKSGSRPMEVFIKKINDLSDIEESRHSLWFDYVSMKTLYSWLPEKEKLFSDIGISMEDAKKMADEKVSKLNLEGMEMTVFEYAVEIGGHSGAPRPEDLKQAGYCFHYTRRLNGIPITYTTATGGFKNNANSEIKPWCYEALDVYVTKDGIDAVRFLNQYTIGDTKVENLELMPFSEIMPIYEKMMIKNTDVLIDRRASGEDVGKPAEALTYRVDRIVFGYSRIYDPQAGDSAGLLVPVWDFFGEYEFDYGEGEGKGRVLVREEHNSFLTINAVDGTVIDRTIGY